MSRNNDVFFVLSYHDKWALRYLNELECYPRNLQKVWNWCNHSWKNLGCWVHCLSIRCTIQGLVIPLIDMKKFLGLLSWSYSKRKLSKLNRCLTPVSNSLSFGGSVYADEQAKFYCDPGEIGIKNLCFSKFSPISFHRFWVAQIIGTSLPLIAYVVTGLMHKICFSLIRIFYWHQ